MDLLLGDTYALKLCPLYPSWTPRINKQSPHHFFRSFSKKKMMLRGLFSLWFWDDWRRAPTHVTSTPSVQDAYPVASSCCETIAPERYFHCRFHLHHHLFLPVNIYSPKISSCPATHHNTTRLRSIMVGSHIIIMIITVMTSACTRNDSKLLGKSLTLRASHQQTRSV